MNRSARQNSARPTPAERRAKRQSALEPGAAVRALTPDAKDPSLVHVRIGRRSAAKIRADAAERLGLGAGAVLDAPLIAEILREQAVTDARYWALRAIARAPVSSGMLELKLRRKGADAASARHVIADLTTRGWLNDRAYAENLVAAELRRKPAGARLLEAKLRSKRIDAPTATEIVRRAIADRDGAGIDESAEALRLAERKARSLLAAVRSGRLEPRAAQQRVYAALARRGFDPETCGRAARSAFNGANASDD